jgi:methyl-accepting chemotaxis protein
MVSNKSPEFQTFCKNNHGEKCDMHFLVENEVISNKDRIEKMEEKTRQSFGELQKTLNEFVIEVRSYIGIQTHRDSDHQEVRGMTRKNSSEIGELKSAIGAISINSQIMAKSVGDISNNVKELNDSIQEIDKKILTKTDVQSIADNAIVKERASKQDKWFDSVPAKISATIAVVSFVSFFIVKIIMLLMAQ